MDILCTFFKFVLLPIGGGAQGASGGTNGRNGSDFGSSYSGGAGSGFDLASVDLESFALSPGVGARVTRSCAGEEAGVWSSRVLRAPPVPATRARAGAGAGRATTSPHTGSRVWLSWRL